MQEILNYQNRLNTFYNIFDNINEGVILTDENNKIIQINKACENISGYKLEEVIGKNPKIFSSDSMAMLTFSKIWETFYRRQNYYLKCLRVKKILSLKK